MARNDELERAYKGGLALAFEILEDWGFTPQEQASSLGRNIENDDELTALKGELARESGDDVEACIDGIVEMAFVLRNRFPNDEAQREWLETPNPVMGNRTPKSIITSGVSENVEFMSLLIDLSNELPPGSTLH